MNVRLATVAVLIATFGTARGANAPVAPTALETMVAQPAAEIVHARPVGTMASTDARLRVTALVVRDSADPAQELRGLEFRLENNSTQDRVYLDRTQLAALLLDLDGIESGIPELESGTGAPYRVQGTASCWRPSRLIRILCPSYAVGPDGAGLGLGAYGGPGFTFPEHRPSELRSLIDDALRTAIAEEAVVD